MKNGSSLGNMNIHAGSAEEFEIRLSGAAKQNITDEEISAVWRTEIYGEEVIRKTLMLDKWVGEKIFEANTAMFEWIELVVKIKYDKSYEQLGYTKFADWIDNHGVSISTVKSWLKLYDAFIIRYQFTWDDLCKYDLKKLNIILPIAEIEGVPKESVKEFLDLITSMPESDLKSMVKEEIASFLSGSGTKLSGEE